MNVGAGETYRAWYVKRQQITITDSMIKDTNVEDVAIANELRSFRYRHLTETEMTYQPITGLLKGKYDKVIFSSDTRIKWTERDAILFENGDRLVITRVLPQTQHGMYLLSKKPPHIVELE